MSEEYLITKLSDNTTVSFADYGDPAGAPLILLHGWPSSRLQGRSVDEAARANGLRLLVPDRPGIGDTTFQPGRTLADWPGWFAQFCDALELGNIHLLAISGGAPYLYATAHAMPERLRSATIMCGAVPLSLFPNRREMMLPYRVLLGMRARAPWALSGVIGFGGLVAKHRVLRPVLSGIHRFLPKSDRCAIAGRDTQECLLEGFQLAVANGGPAVVADADIYLENWEFRLEDIDYPIHFWHGENDNNIPISMVRKVADALPNSIPHWIPEEGHYSIPVKFMNEAIAAFAQ